jgi:hypothetical protein
MWDVMPSITGRIAGVLALVAGLGASIDARLGAQDGSVKITAVRANIRSEAKDTAPVLTQVTAGTDLVLKAIEGDWFRVQLPPDPRLGGARVEAFVSRKVARVVTAPTVTPAVVAAPAEPRDAMSVALKGASTTTFLTPEQARLRVTIERADSVRALSGVLTIEDPPPPSGSVPVTFAWTVPGATSPNVAPDRRPTFVVQFKAVTGFDAADLVPTLLRLAPALSGVRIIAAVRAPADQASRTTADWDVMRDLKQDAVRTLVQPAETGAVLVQPVANLEPGQYAIVLRPNGKKKLAASDVFEGRPFSTIWTFTVR